MAVNAPVHEHVPHPLYFRVRRQESERSLSRAFQKVEKNAEKRALVCPVENSKPDGRLRVPEESARVTRECLKRAPVTIIWWKSYPAGCPAHIPEVTLHSYECLSLVGGMSVYPTLVFARPSLFARPTLLK